ncbi:ABC-type multidrug transport system, ATPase component [Rubellimicrobium mesophilum DSM 19309]|uniref:ABC-type multidrug transport system, ATPase component n=1 Tax=Rubellimicrobium mesophilum DSM 19309 TaxID=442562 RepID=A0A017HN27_9RHOB|nr:ABC transporter ATP-binding protein [Rubellimicrobium mesophilum]EYD75184.1 ABC-type multidrug transport system, ATPase component [Rubellimicrobium mesophilum DSM 19309]
MAPILSIRDLRKTYDSGFEALKGVSLEIEEGEILALLGPNGAGKTTLISAVCGINRITSGTATVGGHDIARDWRAARDLIGLVPQEISLEPFEKVHRTVAFSRGLFGKPKDDAHVEKVLRQLSLWDKRDAKVMELSGGMKRRVLIAKALAHEPRVLFLDEPSAGVDVELRRDMWRVVAELRRSGVTIILTTHYIEEAEAIADRVAVISKGRILLVEEKARLMQQMGQKVLHVTLQQPLNAVPEGLAQFHLTLEEGGRRLTYHYDTKAERTGIATLLSALAAAGITVADLDTEASSLEDIFVGLVHGDEREAAE